MYYYTLLLSDYLTKKTFKRKLNVMKSNFTGPDGAGPMKSTSIRRPLQNTNRPTNNPIRVGPGAPLPSVPSKVI